MFLTNPFPGAFGLDIGDTSVKLVQLRKRHSLNRPAYYFPDTLRSVSLPTGVIINGEIQQPEIVRKKILHLLGKDGAYPKIGTPWVVANLPEPQTFLKLIDIPTPSKDLMYDEISFHASKHLPFELADTYLDWQTLNPNSEDATSHVLIAAVPKVIADSYTYLLEAAELSPLALEAEAVAVARALITSTKDYTGMARAMIDIGGARSCIIIYDHESIQFSKTLNFTGEMFTTAIAQGLKIEREEAEKLKLATGVKYNKEHANYVTIVDTMLGKLVEEIKGTLRFYDEHFSDANPVTHITMCGGSSNLIDLDTVLSQKIKISTRPGNVWKNLAPKEVTDEITDEEKRRGLSYATAIGLGLRAVQNPLMNSSL
ncbi:MAG: pilus assembly protein PilM [Patescibacteria group bacterium]|jgi:type IV pilus assembly protein PilM